MNAQQIRGVENTLNKLHQDARKDYMRIGKGVVKSIFRPMQPRDFEHAYLPISKYQGQAIRRLILENGCQQVVEFGTSFGISTIYLADAVRQIGGQVISTELLPSKAQKAAQNIKNAGLADYVEIKVGDAMKTLKGHTKPIDFLFLDGWKDLYLPLFQMLAPQFHQGTLIYADNMDMSGTERYAEYLFNNNNIYANQFIHDGKGVLTKVK